MIEITEHAQVDDYDAGGCAAPLHSVARNSRSTTSAPGFANLRTSLRLAPDIVKLDLSLTQEVTRDPARLALATSLVELRRWSRSDESSPKESRATETSPRFGRSAWTTARGSTLRVLQPCSTDPPQPRAPHTAGVPAAPPSAKPQNCSKVSGREHRLRPSASAVDATACSYERHSSRIFGFCLSRLGSREDAEDAMQMTFLNAQRGLGRGVVPEFELAWLFKIAQNVCHNRHQSAKRRGRVEARTTSTRCRT